MPQTIGQSAIVSQAVANSAAKAPKKRQRDVRLDVFRGLCLIIIFISHVWDNPWAQFIPARFGFSDATEVFVFCSGMASAIAFGAAFQRHGFMVGAARVLFRCWQVYWCHIGVFLAATTSMILADRWLSTGNAYVEGLGVGPLLGGHTKEALVGLLTLTWVPNYFDILPMYLVILLLLPVVVGLREISRYHAVLFVGLTWAIASSGLLELPAEPWSSRPWYFNPLCWQLIFFTGFAFMSGWIPPPPVDRRLIALAVVFVGVAVPLTWWPLVEHFEIFSHARDWLAPALDKTRFGILRYLHFLSLAYLAYVAVGEGGRQLTGAGVEVLRLLGQQSLAVFMSGLVLSFSASAVLNVTGRGAFFVAVVNLAGIAALIGLARVTAWFKAQPWQKPAAARPNRPTTAAAETKVSDGLDLSPAK